LRFCSGRYSISIYVAAHQLEYLQRSLIKRVASRPHTMFPIYIASLHCEMVYVTTNNFPAACRLDDFNTTTLELVASIVGLVVSVGSNDKIGLASY
jgi:hypothetical protein